MASSMGIRCGGNNHLRPSSSSLSPHQNAHVGPCSVAMVYKNSDVYRQRGRMCISMAMSASRETSIAKTADSSGERGVLFEKLDEWMKDSVTEIVNNLREAPLLVHVYSNSNGENAPTLETEKAVEEENWAKLIEKWKKRESPLPEGVIFVEQLDDRKADGKAEEEEEEENDEEEEDVTRAWGIVVQGKGAECGPVCYLLKTSRVASGLGMGCTHFCLMRVKSFRESAKSQLKNCWLLQAQ